MTNSQLAHMTRIRTEFGRMMMSKYIKGAAEHGDDLQDKKPLELLDEAISEAIDQVTYLLTLREKMITKVVTDEITSKIGAEVVDITKSNQEVDVDSQ